MRTTITEQLAWWAHLLGTLPSRKRAGHAPTAHDQQVGLDLVGQRHQRVGCVARHHPVLRTRAVEVQDALAERSQQRGTKIADLLIAAAAESAGLIVLHYDHDFDVNGGVTGQPTEWIFPAVTVP